MYHDNDTEERWKKEKEEIRNYIERHDITAEQLQAAYELGIGVSTEEDQDIIPFLSKQIKDLANLIDRHTRSGFPLTEVVELIADRRTLESAKNNFKNLGDEF